MKEFGNTYKLREPLMVCISAQRMPYARGNTLLHRQEPLLILGDEHSRMRRQLNSAFSPQSIKDVSHVLFDLAHRLAENFDNNIGLEAESAIFDISPLLHSFAVDAISMTMFAHNLSAGKEDIPGILHNIMNGPNVDSIAARCIGIFIGMFPQLLALPNPMKSWADKLRTELGKIANKVWDEGCSDAGMDAKIMQALSMFTTIHRKEASLSYSLVERDDSNGEAVSRDEAVAQLISILFAGSETVANVLGELLYELARQPAIQDKLRQELLDFQSKYGRSPNYEDLTKSTSNTLPYLDAVTRETMRCKATLMDIARCALEDDVIPLSTPLANTNITQIKVKAGTNISIPIRDGVNVDPEIWGPDADVFRPERWFEDGGLPDSVKAVRALGNIMSFGDGPRICLGRTFAYAEFKIVAATLIPKFVLATEGSKIDFYHLGGNTVKPKVRGREAEGIQLPLCIRRF
ncbi:hypothetical protein EWM64_g3618 [Hericium alpestre]|uniref:Cytochrome P450 n=1 Tax=Hericium alpestre TaxID=135208 RepID=A0A4Z0A2E4_9AGAM|nr:hypothetical protein EWM64_g3618 [Hericium alpestre]